MKMRRVKWLAAAWLTAAAMMCQTAPVWADTAEAAEEMAAADTADHVSDTGTILIAYDNLKELVQNNLDLKDVLESYKTSKENYQAMIDSLTEEREYMMLMAEKYGDTDLKADYKSSASILAANITQLNKQLARLERGSQKTSREKSIASCTQTARNLMCTYNQMSLNQAAQEVRAQAAELEYEKALTQQAAGLATAADVLSASDSLSQARILRDSYRQQTKQAKLSLLTQLGIGHQTEVTIEQVPEPDLEAIDAVDVEADIQKAIGNNSEVQSARTTSAVTMGEVELKASTEAAAEASVRSNLEDLYQQLAAERMEYEAAQDAFSSAALTWQSAQRKRQAGMLSEAEYLEAEATYLQAVADQASVSMELTQAWEGYQLEVLGVSYSTRIPR